MIDKIKQAKRIIQNNKYMILATITTDGKPWSTPVFYATDENYNFYWYSQKNTKHSQAIEKNTNTAAVIFGLENDDEGVGVYIQGKAAEVLEDELEHALETYAAKAATNDEEKQQHTAKEDFLNTSPIRMYKLVPEKIFISTDVKKWKGKWLDGRIEINL